LRGLQVYDRVQALSGFPDVVFASSTANYSLLSRLFSGNEFTDMKTDFAAFRVVKFEIEIIKVISPEKFATIYLNMPSFAFVMYPFYNGTSVGSGDIITNDSALILSPQRPNVKSSRIPPANVFTWVTSGGLPYCINPALWLSTQTIGGPIFPGQVSVGYDGASNATADIDIAQIRITAVCEFAYPY
jgi:hypothetical protein